MRPPAATAPPSFAEGLGLRGGAALLGITLVAGLLRLFRVELWSVSAAEVATWQGVTLPLGGDGGLFAEPMGRHPLVLLALRGLLAAGVLPLQGEGWLRLPFVFAGTLSVPVFALAAGQLVPRRTALFAAALLAVHPWHVAQSQTFAPPIVALALVLVAALAGLAALARPSWVRRLVALGALGLAGASDRSGCLAVPMLAAGGCAAGALLAAPGRRGPWLAGLVFAAAAVVVLQVLLAPAAAEWVDGATPWSLVAQLRLPVVVLGVLAVRIGRQPPWAPFAAAVVPLVGLALAAAGGSTVTAADALPVLPALLLLAAVTATTFAGRLWSPGAGLPGVAAAAVVPTALVGMLAIDVALHESEYQGHRSPWRQAAHLALRSTPAAHDLVVVAGAGWSSLLFYLRPNHWREPGRDLHPGRRVERLDQIEGRGLETFLDGAGDSEVFVVLHSAELAALTREPTAGPRLHAACELVRVLPCPAETGDGTLYVLRRRAAD
ncbi:MAG: hypothetical protein KF830_18270 [Planctomycetes bacterium]|nr:hypothetical protein [Planctomycetota bacterium]